MSFNKVILVGNLGRDPELRYTPQGTPVCSFSMATNERRKDKNGEMQDQTTWFKVTSVESPGGDCRAVSDEGPPGLHRRSFTGGRVDRSRRQAATHARGSCHRHAVYRRRQRRRRTADGKSRIGKQRRW